MYELNISFIIEVMVVMVAVEVLGWGHLTVIQISEGCWTVASLEASLFLTFTALLLFSIPIANLLQPFVLDGGKETFSSVLNSARLPWRNRLSTVGEEVMVRKLKALSPSARTGWQICIFPASFWCLYTYVYIHIYIYMAALTLNERLVLCLRGFISKRFPLITLLHTQNE